MKHDITTLSQIHVMHPLSCKSSMEKPCVVNTTCITLHMHDYSRCHVIWKSSHGGCIITSALDTHNLELANHEFVQRPWTNRRHTLHSLVATVESHGCSFKLGIYNLTQYTYVRQFLFLMLINICMHGHSSNHCLSYTMFDHLSCVAVVYVHIIYSLSLGLNQNKFPFW